MIVLCSAAAADWSTLYGFFTGLHISLQPYTRFIFACNHASYSLIAAAADSVIVVPMRAATRIMRAQSSSACVGQRMRRGAWELRVRRPREPVVALLGLDVVPACVRGCLCGVCVCHVRPPPNPDACARAAAVSASQRDC